MSPDQIFTQPQPNGLLNGLASPAAPRAAGDGSAPDSFAPLAPESAVPPSPAVYGNVSLDLYFGRSEYQMTEYTRSGQDGSHTVRQELYRRFEAGLSLDFSFLSRFDGAAEKMAQLDRSVFDKWSATANDLLSLKEEDFEEFVKATDELFNEIEKALGMGPDGLDHIAGFFASQVDGFIDSVREQMNYFDSHPLGEGEDMGLGIPALLDAAKQSMPEDFRRFMDETLAGLGVDAPDTGGEIDIAKLLEIFRREMEKFLDSVKERDGKEDPASDSHDEPGDGDKPAEDPAVGDGGSRTIEVSYYRKEVFQAYAEFSYEAGQPAVPSGADDGSARPAVDIAA